MGWVYRLFGKGETYGAVDDMLVACTVVYVYCYAAQRRDFGGEFIEARVVLLFAFVGGHGSGLLCRETSLALVSFSFSFCLRRYV